jgi:predicted alpha/beta-fold hydrolase
MYRAPRWLTNRHLMTVWASLVRLPRWLPVERQRWELPDGDFLDVDRLRAPDDAPVVIVCHGLEGSSRAGYVRGLLAEAHARGLGGVAINFRGCSGELNRLARFYHSGDTGDLANVVERLVRERPGRPLGLSGFSLGGNVVTKYLGERGDALPPEVRAAAVISVPFDLAGCCEALDAPGVASWFYRERFLRRLKRKAVKKALRFTHIDAQRARVARTLQAFDDAVTAPLHGFSSAKEYYARSSSAGFLAGVRRPLLVIQAEDDPFVPPSTLPRRELTANPHISLELSHTGGHVAFVHGPPWRLLRFAERRAVAFLDEKLRPSA